MWPEKDKKLYREFKFDNFKEAFDFMAKVAAVADKMEIWLSTHSAGDKITDKDRQLAEEIDRIYGENA
jgi:4a-hydroxytetrahydrobiopterin dehydratase